MPEPIRVGVIGCGEIAQIMHLRFLDELPEFELTALCDLSSDVLERLGARYSVKHLYNSYLEMIDAGPVDAVVVATPQHREPALAALENGKHLLLEKPVAYSIAEAQEIAAAASRAASSVAMVGYMRVYDPGYEAVRHELLGEEPVRLVRSHNFGGDLELHHPLFRVVRPGPGEALENHLAEEIGTRTAATLRSAVGEDDHLQFMLWALLLGCSHDLSVVRDVAGSATSIESSYIDSGRLLACVAHKHAVCTYEWDTSPGYPWWDQELSVFTSNAVLTVHFADPYIPYQTSLVEVHRANGRSSQVCRPDVSNEPAFRREWQHFARCIRTGEPPRTTIQGGCEDVELITELVRGAPPRDTRVLVR